MVARMPEVRTKDTKTRFQGVYARHRQACALTRGGERCSCRPAFWGRAWDRATQKTIKTAMLPTAGAASGARNSLIQELKQGVTPAGSTMFVAEAVKQFLAACRSGVALNKKDRRYKPSAVRDLEGCLLGHVVPELGTKRLGNVRRGDVQRLVDRRAPTHSGSRVRSVVNAIRSLYAWAQDRDLVEHDPAGRVRLPAVDATPRDRVATPAELTLMLDALPLSDALPYALAAYATARRAEIRHALVEDVDFDLGVIYLGVDEDGRKSAAARRAMPMPRVLVPLVKRALLERGKPAPTELLCPGAKPGGRNSGMLSFGALQVRADKVWEARGLERITAHELRHTCASWLDAAGVRPRVVSELMGHAVPRALRDAAPITQQRYTHTLPGDLERARELFDAFLGPGASPRRSQTG
jgi:integrase